MAKNQNNPSTLRFPKPKILVIDCDAAVAKRLADQGYNVTIGTFGKPYRVPCEDGFTPIISRPILPNHSEQEVVIIDLSPPDTATAPEGEKRVSFGTEDWWGSRNSGYVDPRPRAMAFAQEAFDRLFCAGGIFVVFCEPRYLQDLRFGIGNKFGQIDQWAKKLEFDNWSFLSIFAAAALHVYPESGAEITVEPSALAACLRRNIDGANFSASLHPQWPLSKDADGPTFFPMLKNKYDAPVGGAILNPKAKGLVLLLPHFANKASLIHDLFTNVLPDMLPRTFPFSGYTNWLKRNEYEHPRVLLLVAQQNAIREQAEKAIERLETDIAKEREHLGYLHGILTKTGDALVRDVKQALETIGFTQVIDVDEEVEEGSAKQEDLQIHDAKPLLLAEIKGLSGLPTESDTLQVVKYIPRRMKEWRHTDVSGLVIMNHQRSIPPLERHHDSVFTTQQKEDAEHHDITLLTTWELFRMIRGMFANEWDPDVLRGLFYGKGPINPIPLHWKQVGHVAHFYDKAAVVSIALTGELNVGDTIGILLPTEYVEEEVTSLQVEREQVQHAVSGQRVGHKTVRRRSEFREGLAVFIVAH